MNRGTKGLLANEGTPVPATVTSVQPGADDTEGVGEGVGGVVAEPVGVGVALRVAPAVGEGLLLDVALGAVHCTRVTMFAPVFDTHSVPVDAE